jgi:hypothetical protein
LEAVAITIESITTTASGTEDMLETIGTVSVGRSGNNEAVGDGDEVLDVDEGCFSCWADGVGVGRGGLGLNQGCLKDSVEVMRFLSSKKKKKFLNSFESKHTTSTKSLDIILNHSSVQLLLEH